MSKGPHSIPLKDAAALTLRWRRNCPPDALHGARFDRIAFDNILSQPDCTGIRIYLGHYDPRDPAYADRPTKWTLVMVGTDAKGNDITTIVSADGSSDGDTEQLPNPCPPFCSEPGPLNTPP